MCKCVQTSANFKTPALTLSSNGSHVTYGGRPSSWLARLCQAVLCLWGCVMDFVSGTMLVTVANKCTVVVIRDPKRPASLHTLWEF